MLVEVVVVEARDGRLENVRRRCRAGRITPLPGRGVEMKRGPGLRAGQAELTGAGEMPGGRVTPEDSQALRDAFLGQRGHGARPGEQRLDAVVGDELDGTGAVLTDVGQQRERVAGGDLEIAAPALQHPVVVRKQSLAEGP